jgi:5-methylcytosine-specific restriction endonuclease McrA
VDEKSVIIASVCSLLGKGAPDAAAHLLRRDYPFAPEEVTVRRYGPVESTCVYIRDGFIDRYTGAQLIFPPSCASFPPCFHPSSPSIRTGRRLRYTPLFANLGATVDHLVPVTRGGADDESNWVTISMARNSAKMNWTLDELRWTLHPPGDVREWDGMMRWFLEYIKEHPETSSNASVRQWYRAAELITGVS